MSTAPARGPDPVRQAADSRRQSHERSLSRGRTGRAPGTGRPAAARREEGSLRGRRDSAARSCAEADVRLGDPARTARRAGNGNAGRGRRHPGAGQPRGAGLRHGGGRQLQRHLGLARHAGLAFRHSQGAVPHRRLRRQWHRLGGRRESAQLEGRRRGRHPLQPGRRRRRGMQRRRPDVLDLPAHLGLRDAGRLLRPSSPASRPSSSCTGRST